MTSFPGRSLVRRVWRRVDDSPLHSLAWRVRLLPRSIRNRVGRPLARLALAIGGPEALPAAAHRGGRSSWGALPERWRVLPRPEPPESTWQQPPDVARAGIVVRSVYDTGNRPPVMDLALLEALNEEYRSKPLVPEPPKYDQPSRENRAQSRLAEVHRAIDLAGKRVLEVGCGAGFEVWYLSHHFGADAWGADVSERVAWKALTDERTHFVCTDLSIDHAFEADSIDRVISFSVLEHVVHPYGMLAELYRIMKPGGLAWISANLHRGPRASHLYRELYFPFPHLLFSDDVIREYRSKHHGKAEGAAWVNRVTWAQYEDYIREIGFTMRSLRFSETPLDEAFYARFDDILGRYPRWDLTKDFFYTILEKPRK